MADGIGLDALYEGTFSWEENKAFDTASGGRVTAVTVFQPGAEVTWQFPVSPSAPGLGQLTIRGLPETANLDTIRAMVPDSDALILEVVSETERKASTKDLLSLNPREELKATKKMKKAKNQEIDVYRDQAKLYEQYITKVEDLPTSTKDKTMMFCLLANDNISSFMSLLDRLQTSLFDTNKKIFDLTQELHEIELRETLLNAQIKGLNENKEVSHTLTILIFARSQAELKVNVSFMIPEASWTPSYDLRADSLSGELQITYYGVVKQKTTQDWDKVKLSLSTASPNSAASPPALNPANVYLQPRYHRQSKFLSSVPLGGLSSSVKNESPRLRKRQVAEECDMLMDQSAIIPMKIATATVSDNMSSFTFSIPRLATIQSDDKDHKVTVTMLTLDSVLRFEVLPRLSPKAFLRAKAKNTSGFPLLAGSARVFVGNSYICETKLNSVNPNEKFVVFLGVDDAIKVDSREPKAVGNLNHGLFSKGFSTSVKSITKITNTTPSPVKVVLRDQLPVSLNSSTKVEMQEPDLDESPHVTLNPRTNQLKWHLPIPPGEEVSVPFSYCIEYPPAALSLDQEV